jgi:hypothetical protein
MEFKQHGGVVRSANFTPDKLTDIGSRSKDIFIKRFKSFEGSNCLEASIISIS